MTVTVCAVLQLAGVKVRLVGETVPSVVSLLDRSMLTLALGWVPSTTVKVALPPASVVTRPLLGLTVMPGELELVWRS